MKAFAHLAGVSDIFADLPFGADGIGSFFQPVRWVCNRNSFPHVS